MMTRPPFNFGHINEARVENRGGKTKRLSLLVSIFLTLQIGCNAVSSRAQDNNELIKIKKTIEAILRDVRQRDFDSARQLVSNNFSCTIGVTTMDFAEFKAYFKNVLYAYFDSSRDTSAPNIEILSSDISDHDATIIIQYLWQGFNLSTLAENSWKGKRQISLTKESGVWKITKWIWILPE